MSQSNVAARSVANRRGVLGTLAILIEHAARAEANSSSSSQSYWTSVARGL
ncbi:MAG: hypothetical protein LC797_08350 [Chloroflexi bacterium]|nr:hypothetical protein [Chloroflexota bacterium]